MICDICGLKASVDEGYEYQEFINIALRCGYGEIHGDDKAILANLCQHCFADMCDDTLAIIYPIDDKNSNIRLFAREIFSSI